MGRKKKDAPVVPGYTVKQSEIILGLVSLDEVNGHLAGQFLKRAISLNDKENIELAQQLVNRSSELVFQKKIERARERRRALNAGTEIVWRQPKTSEYTEHQKAVVRGEVPLSDVHSNELISIHQKAKMVGDFELAERMYDLIMDRRNAEIEKRRGRLDMLYRRRNTQVYDNSEYDECYRRPDSLTPWEEDVLSSEIPLDECPLDHMMHIVRICEMLGNEEQIRLANQLLLYKEHPEVLYVTQDVKQAIDDIERMMGRPIRRPETWFNE